jgi:hypothetical protein
MPFSMIHKHTKTQQELKITLKLLNILSTFIRVTCFVLGFWGHQLDRGLQKRKIYYKNQFRFCFCQPLGLASAILYAITMED